MQLTREAQAAIEAADLVLYVVTESLTARAIEQMNGKARSLGRHYATGRSRRDTYDRMVEEIITELRMGQRVCAVFYGHPGVGVDPGHEAVIEARKLGFHAEMLPGISAADCLYADVGIDPADAGAPTPAPASCSGRPVPSHSGDRSPQFRGGASRCCAIGSPSNTLGIIRSSSTKRPSFRASIRRSTESRFGTSTRTSCG